MDTIHEWTVETIKANLSKTEIDARLETLDTTVREKGIKGLASEERKFYSKLAIAQKHLQPQQ